MRDLVVGMPEDREDDGRPCHRPSSRRVVEAVDLADEPGQVEHGRASPLDVPEPVGLFGRQPERAGEGRRSRVVVVEVDQPVGEVHAEHVAVRRLVARHDRDPGGHALEQRQPEALGAARERRHGGARQATEVLGVRVLARERHAPPEPEPGDEVVEAVALGPVLGPGDLEPPRDRRHERERGEQVVDPLVMRHAAGDDDEAGLGRPGELGERRQVDGVLERLGPAAKPRHVGEEHLPVGLAAGDGPGAGDAEPRPVVPAHEQVLEPGRERRVVQQAVGVEHERAPRRRRGAGDGPGHEPQVVQVDDVARGHGLHHAVGADGRREPLGADPPEADDTNALDGLVGGEPAGPYAEHVPVQGHHGHLIAGARLRDGEAEDVALDPAGHRVEAARHVQHPPRAGARDRHRGHVAASSWKPIAADRSGQARAAHPSRTVRAYELPGAMGPMAIQRCARAPLTLVCNLTIHRDRGVLRVRPSARATARPPVGNSAGWVDWGHGARTEGCAVADTCNGAQEPGDDGARGRSSLG